MKKNYIVPVQRVAEIDAAEMMMALSNPTVTPDPDNGGFGLTGGQDADADEGGAVKGQSSWDMEW